MKKPMGFDQLEEFMFDRMTDAVANTYGAGVLSPICTPGRRIVVEVQGKLSTRSEL
jgi:hypothetical protein